MQTEDAAALIRSAVEGHEGLWFDVGAGRGTFTKALVQILGPESRVVAIDRDPDAVNELRQWVAETGKPVEVVDADFMAPGFAIGSSGPLQVDGLLFANSLHFVKDAGALLDKFTGMLRPGGRVVLVEYDRRGASRWVPHPISIASLADLAQAAGLLKFRVVESRPSNYEGLIYCAVAVL